MQSLCLFVMVTMAEAGFWSLFSSGSSSGGFLAMRRAPVVIDTQELDDNFKDSEAPLAHEPIVEPLKKMEDLFIDVQETLGSAKSAVPSSAEPARSKPRKQ